MTIASTDGWFAARRCSFASSYLAWSAAFAPMISLSLLSAETNESGRREGKSRQRCFDPSWTNPTPPPGVWHVYDSSEIHKESGSGSRVMTYLSIESAESRWAPLGSTIHALTSG